MCSRASPSYSGGWGWRIAWAQEFWTAVRYADRLSTLSSASIWWPPGSRGPPGCLRRGEPAQVGNGAGQNSRADQMHVHTYIYTHVYTCIYVVCIKDIWRNKQENDSGHLWKGNRGNRGYNFNCISFYIACVVFCHVHVFLVKKNFSYRFLTCQIVKDKNISY